MARQWLTRVLRAFLAAFVSGLAWLLPWVPGSNVQGEPPSWGFQHVRTSTKTILSAAFRAFSRLRYNRLDRTYSWELCCKSLTKHFSCSQDSLQTKGRKIKVSLLCCKQHNRASTEKTSLLVTKYSRELCLACRNCKDPSKWWQWEQKWAFAIVSVTKSKAKDSVHRI